MGVGSLEKVMFRSPEGRLTPPVAYGSSKSCRVAHTSLTVLTILKKLIIAH